jgi:hypothetical protein
MKKEQQLRLEIKKLLKEMYIDSQGNLIGEADFVILEGGDFGGIFKNKNQININEYINFTTKLDLFKEKSIGNNIYKQIFSIYNQSALKKYNDSINFVPSYVYSIGGGGDMHAYYVNISNKLEIWGALEPHHYFHKTGYDDFIKKMRKFAGIDDSGFKDNEDRDSKRFGEVDIKDIETKLKHISVTCIPKFQFDGGLMEQFDETLINKNVPGSEEHYLYSKSDLLNDLNEIGLFLLSKKKKSSVVDLNEEGYKLYTLEFIAKVSQEIRGKKSDYFIGKDDTISEFRYKDLLTYYVMGKNNESFESAIKRLDPFYHTLLYMDNMGLNKNYKGQDKPIELIKIDIKEIKDIKLDIDFFNLLKNKVFKDNNEIPNIDNINQPWDPTKRGVKNINGVLSVESLK